MMAQQLHDQEAGSSNIPRVERQADSTGTPTEVEALRKMSSEINMFHLETTKIYGAAKKRKEQEAYRIQQLHSFLMQG